MGYLKSGDLLAAEQRQELKQVPSDLNAREMAAYYSLSQQDIEIINCHRRNPNRLGFAVQLSVLRYPGWPLVEIDSIPYNVHEYIARKLL